ncbi:MAG TPA: histidine kinase dimerization/phospho-acceptor domain-containing protein, partial [Pseudobdellovibrionaceae bacterium]|nr:histidine kinase dimerization/phospho-acceptor domain-containing protein [Pseudobdellovibrionaceae bacterium]
MILATSAFRRHYLISVTVIIVGLVISLIVSFYLASLERERSAELEKDRAFTAPTHLFKKVFELSKESPQETVDRLSGAESRFSLRLLAWNSPEILSLSEEQRGILRRGEGSTEILLKNPDRRAPNPPSLLQVFLGRAPPGPPPGGPRGEHLLSLGGDVGVLAVGIKPMTRKPPTNPIPLTLACLFLGVVITTGIAIFLMFSNYKKRAQTAENVLKELKSGNLSARLPVYKMDELSKLVTSFNHMADEIENLVHRVKSNEARRLQVLQQLAHDLRTPIASMRTFLESLKEDRARMTEEQIQRSINLSFAESQYFERLVEDLLTLASLGEPRQSEPVERIPWRSLISSVVEKVQGHSAPIKVDFSLDEGALGSDSGFEGRRKLLERMLRNGLENAVSFARSKVHLRMWTQDGEHLITITDDGPGLDEAA